jgi:N-carbamoylputrescine amidase
MKVTVCEISNNQDELEENWQKLIDHTKAENSDLVLLPEMPFCKWIPGTHRADPDLWQQSVNIHEQWMSRFTELPSHIVVGTRPVVRDGERFNDGFIWEKNTGYK